MELVYILYTESAFSGDFDTQVRRADLLPLRRHLVHTLEHPGGRRGPVGLRDSSRTERETTAHSTVTLVNLFFNTPL
ncbi:hypothetical protein RRG08_032967 [Elysia crispata]|uniref:Uncharacterized protein n=1 Tax=Elysia crispata TaxID=231223 RepID=A0AAE1D3K5_9GAST|nr:hypothetical protein RRG08_032967 [Elysia crispata]